MSVLFILLMTLTTAIFVIVSWISVKRHEKHDSVLFSFSRLQSAVMKEILARHDAGTLTRKNLESAKFLLDMLDDIARHYDRHKTVMFNLRKMRRMVEQDFSRHQEMRREAQLRLAEISSDAKIVALYEEFSHATVRAFLAYTPFIRTEILLRLLMGDIAGQIAKVKQEAQQQETQRLA